MHLKPLAVGASLVALASSTIGAQSPELTLGGGFTNRAGMEFDPALHLIASAQTSSNRSLQLRADVLLEQGFQRDLLALGNFVYVPVRRAVAPYVIAGAGVYFDNGTPFVAAGGFGLLFRSATRVNTRLEARLASAPDPRVVLTLSVQPW